MPDPQEGETRDDFISRCIPIVLDDGTASDQEQAVSVCSGMWDQAKKGIEIVFDDALISFGDEVKTLDNGHLGGYLVRFSSPDDPDLTGDFFTKDTDFRIADGQKTPIFFNHRLPIKTRDGKRIAIKSVIGEGTLAIDDVGVFIDAILYNRDEYEKAITKTAHKQGWSSGTAAHLVDREEAGNAMLVKTWPLGLDSSITPTPAEPRNNVISLKSLMSELPPTPQAATPGAEAPTQSQEPDPSGEENMMEITQEQLDELGLSVGTKAGEAAGAAAGKAVEAALKSLPAINPAGVVVTEDEADRPFKSLGEQLHAVKTATLSQGRNFDVRLSRLDIKALGANELIGSEGGFLLEPSFAAEILKPVHETGPFSSRSAKLPIGPNSNGVIVRAIDETDRATGSRWGGIQGYRLAEAGTKLATNPAFRFVELRLKKFAVLCYATEEILQDTTALASIIQQGASEELDFMVNDDILNGAGNAGPLGILNSPALVSVTKETGQAADTLVTQNIFKMWARMHPRSKMNAVWYINTEVTPQLYQLSLSVGTGGMPMYMAPGSLPNAPSGALLGRPVVETEFNAGLGDKGDIVLADMSQYVMIDRDVQAASSIHVQFLTDQVAYRFVYRCDGQPKISAPLTPYKGTSNTLSPFVTLNERA